MSVEVGAGVEARQHGDGDICSLLGFDRLFCVLVETESRVVESLGVGLEEPHANHLADIYNSGCRRTPYSAVVRPIAIRVCGRSPLPSLDRPPRKSG